MKKWMIAALAALAVILPRLGSPATDIGNLEPVAVVQVIGAPNGVLLRTDTGAEGRGRNFAEAVRTLRSSAPKEVFLDTADFVLLWGNPDRGPILELFRPACGVCLAGPETNLEEAAAYLTQHPPGRTLAELRAGEGSLPRLIVKEGRGLFARNG